MSAMQFEEKQSTKYFNKEQTELNNSTILQDPFVEFLTSSIKMQ